MIYKENNLLNINSNFTMNNNYGLSYGINGHHIGIIIPENLYILIIIKKKYFCFK